ncbi:MAG: transcription-repair coupling factor [Candidatus Izemoplasmatales bacterium]|uniref:Transcription-repair-coupling factor n=1 Tax=Hujiaoplasma nucleasis TaxID=2725268 RepID=A0A7L6N5I3_9MOLU|nr:transcription-repair coupling factor [Hujiaoplasma nucleasis]QLY40527.1 transcription-repair coupling factor [Hujiaoplasma nucleasis]
MENILKHIQKNPLLQEITNKVKAKQNIYINNTNEDNALLVLLSLYKKLNQTFFIVTPNLYTSQLVYDKLSRVLEKDQVNFYPQDEFLTNELLVSSNEFRLERINTIDKIINHNPRIVVVNLYGILKPLFNKNKWSQAMMTIRKGNQYNIQELKETLINLGYNHQYTVEKIGDFAIRGGILDIFPINTDNPYRLDFFGDEVDVIKTFDLDSQRSIDQVNEFRITPMTDFFYDDQEFNILKEKIKLHIEDLNLSEDSLKQVDDDLQKLSQRDELDRLSRYLPFMTEKHTTLLDLADNAHTFFLDYHRILDQNQILIEEIKEWYEQANDYPKMRFNLLYDFLEVDRLTSIKIDYLDFFYKEKFPYTYSIFGESVTTYNENLEYFFNDLEKNKNKLTHVLAFQDEKYMHEFAKLLKNKNIEYILNKQIKSNAINLILDDQVFNFHSRTFETKVITEEALRKRSIQRKRGDYISVYKRSTKLSGINDLKPGDYVVHYHYGIGKFLEIKTMTFGQQETDYIHIEYQDKDKLYITLDAIDQIHKYSASEGFSPKLSKIGGKSWSKAKERVRKQVQEIADQLIDLYSRREKSQGFSYENFPDLENEFSETFEYIETQDQVKTIEEVFKDMNKTTPMDRLICGDVGFGKTEVALRAAFKAVLNKKQVSYLAPTTVLSKQHYETFKNRMTDFGINVKLINRFISSKEQKQVLQGIKSGHIDILIGTHRLLSKDIEFKDLGLLIIDEEQRFGVLHKERIKEMKVNIDVLSLSATPIPRTLNMAIMGVKNMSLLETAPENRYPVQTYVLERNKIILRDAIERELARKGQVFYLFNRVSQIDFIADQIQDIVPYAKIGIAHGQMSKNQLENIIDQFINQELDVLISTTIIETGIDIPNANTLIVHDADMLGLSQLYQIRGRVGRSNKIAYAYLMYEKNKRLTPEAEKRLKVIKEFTELGSGFKIALRDLSIRGAGDVLGKEQSGFIDSVGIDMYMKILEEEIHKVQGKEIESTENKGVKAKVSKFIDKDYIEDDYIKIEMHKKIKNVRSLKEVVELLSEIKDRFGHYSIDLEIYIYEQLFEYLTKSLDIEKIKDTKSQRVLIVSKESTKKMAGDQIFKSGLDVSKDIRFAYKNEQIHIILDTVNLKKHWLFTMVEFLDKINS